MSDLQQQMQAAILLRLKRRKNQRLTPRDFNKVKEAIKKQFETDDTAIAQAIERMLREQFLSRSSSGTYILEKKGVDHLAQLELALSGPAPEINEVNLPFQKAFVLLQLFCAKDESRSLSRSELHKKLASKLAERALLFSRMSGDTPILSDRPTMDLVIQQLVFSKHVKEQKQGQGARYTLSETGQGWLVATDQHPTLEVRLKGKQLNALREAIRDADPVTPPEPHEQPAMSAPPEMASPHAELTVEAVEAAFEELRRERFARNGIVPVFELRRFVSARHGTSAASHAILDPLLKQMRREKRFRLIAIGDLSEATTDQLDDSVPGEHETFFYLESAHEHAQV